MKTPYEFPTVELSEPALLWMRAVYSSIKKGQSVSSRVLKIQLHGKLPIDFSPYAIDDRLLQYGTELTLLGIWHLDPKSKLFERTDQVIRAIRALVLANPEKTEFSVADVYKETGIPRKQIGTIFRMLTISGPSWSLSLGNLGTEPDSVAVRDEVTLGMYLNYEGLEQVIRTLVKKEYRSGNIGTFFVPTTTQTINPSHGVEVFPIFRSNITQIDPKLCFVLMPFSEEWSNRVYFTLIRKTVEAIGLQCLRADNLTGQIIIEDIWTKINQCGLVIADVTTRNPNVMYELGITHTVGKPTILITQESSSIPFDFFHLRHFEYKDHVDGFKALSERLPEVVREIYDEYYPGIL